MKRMDPKVRRENLKKYVNTTLIGGFLVILPLALLLIVFKWIFNFILNFINPITKLLTIGGRIDGFLANLMAITPTILLCFGVGLFAKTTIGAYVFHEIEDKFLSRIPFYKGISETVKQFSNREKVPFSEVVMVDVFGTGTRMTGFVTDEHEDDMITVFVPTGPNPTNGFIFHVKKDQVVYVDVPSEEAMKSIIGVGSGSKNLIATYHSTLKSKK